MSSNKVNNKLDFRNVKQTQLDSAQTLKGSFSELQSALRTFGTNAILKDAYTDIIQITNAQGESNSCRILASKHVVLTDKTKFRADVAGDLAGTYFTIQEYSSKKTHAFYYVVSGVGVAPGVGDIETPIILENNDTAAIVTYSTKLVLDSIEGIIVVQKSLLSSFLTIEYLEFGGDSLVDVATSGFMTSNLVQGESFKVGEICLDYDLNGNPIYNGNVLKGMKYNVYTASFDVAPGNIEIQDGDGNKLEINPDGSINTVPVKDYDSFEVISRDSFGNITQVEYSMTNALVRTIDLTYDADGCLLTYVETEA